MGGSNQLDGAAFVICDLSWMLRFLLSVVKNWLPVPVTELTAAIACNLFMVVVRFPGA